MELVERRDISSVTGADDDVQRVSELAFARIRHDYDRALLTRIERKARLIAEDYFAATSTADGDRFLGLRHIRYAQHHIPEVRHLMTDPARLTALSALAATELAPYPIARASAHINFYLPGEVPIEYHTDGAAMVELIPLSTRGSTNGGGTLIYRGPAASGEHHLAKGGRFTAIDLEHIPQDTEHSVLMQGRRLLHRAERFTDGERVTLVFALESVAEPWKDDNTLMRLLLDDPLETVIDDWTHQAQRRARLYSRTRQPNIMAGETEED